MQGAAGPQRTPDTEQAVRSQFLDLVHREDNLVDAKERWFKIYVGLQDVDEEIEKQVKDVKEALAKSRGNHAGSRLQNVQNRLNAAKTSHAVLRALAVRQYALLLKFEKLEEQNQRKGLGKGDYLQEKRMLLDEINRVEQLRFWENFRDDLIDSVVSLQGAIHETAQEVENTANAVRSIPPRLR